MNNSYAMVPTMNLVSSGYNPNRMTEAAMSQLVEEVKRQGRLLKPVVATRKGDKLVIVDGEHNWGAAFMAGLAEVPVEIVEADDFEARRQTFVRNLSGDWHKVRLGRMFVEMQTLQDQCVEEDMQYAIDEGTAGYGIFRDPANRASNRTLAKWLGVSEGTVRNMMLYARAADLVGRDYVPLFTEDEIAAMTIREVRKLIAQLEGVADEEEQQAPDQAPDETRILGRLKRAWNKASEDERDTFITWTGAADAREVAAYNRGFADGSTEAAKAEARNDHADEEPKPRTSTKAPKCAGCGKRIKSMKVEHQGAVYHHDCAAKAAGGEKSNGEARSGYADRHAILEARKARNWSQTELAKAVGTRQPIISRLEAGKTVADAIVERVVEVLELSQ